MKTILGITLVLLMIGCSSSPQTSLQNNQIPQTLSQVKTQDYKSLISKFATCGATLDVYAQKQSKTAAQFKTNLMHKTAENAAAAGKVLADIAGFGHQTYDRQYDSEKEKLNALAKDPSTLSRTIDNNLDLCSKLHLLQAELVKR